MADMPCENVDVSEENVPWGPGMVRKLRERFSSIDGSIRASNSVKASVSRRQRTASYESILQEPHEPSEIAEASTSRPRKNSLYDFSGSRSNLTDVPTTSIDALITTNADSEPLVAEPEFCLIRKRLRKVIERDFSFRKMRSSEIAEEPIKRKNNFPSSSRPSWNCRKDKVIGELNTCVGDAPPKISESDVFSRDKVFVKQRDENDYCPENAGKCFNRNCDVANGNCDVTLPESAPERAAASGCQSPPLRTKTLLPESITTSAKSSDSGTHDPKSFIPEMHCEDLEFLRFRKALNPIGANGLSSPSSLNVVFDSTTNIMPDKLKNNKKWSTGSGDSYAKAKLVTDTSNHKEKVRMPAKAVSTEVAHTVACYDRSPPYTKSTKFSQGQKIPVTDIDRLIQEDKLLAAGQKSSGKCLEEADGSVPVRLTNGSCPRDFGGVIKGVFDDYSSDEDDILTPYTDDEFDFNFIGGNVVIGSGNIAINKKELKRSVGFCQHTPQAYAYISEDDAEVLEVWEPGMEMSLQEYYQLCENLKRQAGLRKILQLDAVNAAKLSGAAVPQVNGVTPAKPCGNLSSYMPTATAGETFDLANNNPATAMNGECSEDTGEPQQHISRHIEDVKPLTAINSSPVSSETSVNPAFNCSSVSSEASINPAFNHAGIPDPFLLSENRHLQNEPSKELDSTQKDFCNGVIGTNCMSKYSAQQAVDSSLLF